MKSFSFIIPLFNSQKDLTNCLESLVELNYPKDKYEIILIDDGLNDLSILPNFKSINLKVYKNVLTGAASARNYGISLAKNEILVFLDQDVIVDKNILTIYCKALKLNYASVIQGNIWRQFKVTRLTEIHSRWRRIVFINKARDGNDTKYINTIITRNIAIDKNVLVNIKNKYGFIFNENFSGTGGEDRDLGCRIYNAGYKIYLNDKAIVRHKDPDGFYEILMQKYRHARGDTRMGVGERFFDLSNFRRAVLTPTFQGVPFYFCFLIWLFHVSGCELERLSSIFTRNHHPRSFE